MVKNEPKKLNREPVWELHIRPMFRLLDREVMLGVGNKIDL